MKSPRFINLSAALLILPATLFSSEDRSMQNAAYQASVEQEQVRSQTRRLAADISAMLEEFRKNPAATEEVALTEATLQKLRSLSDAEMAAVSLALRDVSKASKTAETSPKLVAASKTAKEIQVTLTKLADKLALYQDEASIELRLTTLVRRQLSNQRQAKNLADGAVQADEKDKEAQLTAVEQKAIAEESDNLLQSLRRLAANPTSSARAAFAAAYSAGATSLLIPSTQTASARAEARDFPNALTAQGQVISALQAMLVALGTDKPLEERYRAAEQQLRSLATKEQALARTTTKSSLPQQRAIVQRQQEIADERALIEREIVALSPAAVPLLNQARQTMENLDNSLQNNKQLLDRPDEKLGVVNTQNEIARIFLDTADLLKKQADAVAQQSNSGQGNPDQSRQSLANAATSVMNAIGNMDMARQLLERGSDTGTAKDQMAKAHGNLDNAMKQLGEAGNAAPQGAGENLQSSSKSLGKGEEQASQGGGNENRMKANISVAEARDSANRALREMQKSLSAMSSQTLAGGQARNPSQPTEGTGGGAGWGTIFQHSNDFTSFSALAKVSDKDRAALSMLQREKAPPEYDTMARQYMKNLADGVVPAQ